MRRSGTRAAPALVGGHAAAAVPDRRLCSARASGWLARSRAQPGFQRCRCRMRRMACRRLRPSAKGRCRSAAMWLGLPRIGMICTGRWRSRGACGRRPPMARCPVSGSLSGPVTEFRHCRHSASCPEGRGSSCLGGAVNASRIRFEKSAFPQVRTLCILHGVRLMFVARFPVFALDDRLFGRSPFAAGIRRPFPGQVLR